MAERFPAEDSGHGSGSGGGNSADGSNPDGQEFSDNYSKYLILGGGMSGLSAAAHLANRGQGRHLKVLEARNRLGGRIMTFQIGQKGQTMYSCVNLIEDVLLKLPMHIRLTFWTFFCIKNQVESVKP